MQTIIEWNNETSLRITTKRGEEVIGYITCHPPYDKSEVERLFDVVRYAFDNTDNLAEARNFIELSVERLAFGMLFKYLTPPSIVRRKNVGNQIKILRESKGYSLREFAFMTQMDPSNYSKIELGKHAVSVDTLNKICYYLDADIQIVPKEGSENIDNSYRIFSYE